MAQISYTPLVPGAVENVNTLNVILAALATGINTVDSDQLNTGAVSSAAKIADAIITQAKMASEAWSTYTPTIGGGVATGTSAGYYYKLGRHVTARGYVNFTGGLTAGPATITLPVAAGSTGYQFGIVTAFDASVDYAHGYLEVAPSASTGTFRVHGGNNATISTVDATHPWTWATGDNIHFNITYEAAS